ncbi:SulP family inorganic anion transporter [Aurantiacibacter poecillastricola]|uniref:SulP family inorganic anion transporter n=1 Tax=Aurantiacibacter poecillastricola TaxID=3064385 RepID=UPI00273F621B|nr:SulP family inorganic anion transporter [Aurantiacibacter sp. 219JJ12-13]MDP5261167.1 SulP family inorganic anion transporter [Aurantiacibacter sp. 219JJ12-13]
MAGKALVPRFGWLTSIGGKDLLKDGIAGVILSILLVPQAMAYAQLAGLPPQMGLYAAMTPPLLYAVFGTSPYVSVGPVALVSLIVAEASGAAGGDPMSTVAIIAIEAGLILLVVGAIGLGRLVNFVSEPAMLGFTAAAAFLIAASQLPPLLGLDTERAGDLPTALGLLWSALPDTSMPTAVIGGSALVALLVVHRFAAPLLWKAGLHPPWRQAVAKSFPLLIIVGAALAAASYNGTVPTVEAVQPQLPKLPQFGSIDLWIAVLPSAAAVAIIVFVTATAVAKSLAGTDRSGLDTSREAVALGAGNIVAALSGGYAVGASLSRSALVEESGARSPLASVVGALVVLATLLFLAPLLAYLPRTALAALVISAVFGLIKPKEIKSIWGHDRLEGYIVVAAFLATLVLGVRLGLAIGAGLSVAHFMWFSSVPRVTRIGSDDGGASFRSVDRDDVEIITLPVLGIRIDRSIYFGNAEFVEEQIFKLINRHDNVECVVLDMRAVNGVDASGCAMLRRLAERFELAEMQLHFAAAHQPVVEKLKSLDRSVCQFHRTVQEAVGSCGVSLDEVNDDDVGIWPR